MIIVENLSFRYDKNYVLKDVNLVLEKGHIYGLVGPNGSGKTTLLNCLSSFYYPNSGEIRYDNKPIENNYEYLKSTILLDDNYFVGMMKVDRLARKLSEMYDTKIDESIFKKLLDVFKIKRDSVLQKLSKGNRKVAIISIILSLKPKVLFLDEFLDGIDIVNRRYIKDYLLDYIVENDAIIVISSHALDDVKDICDDLILISSNKTYKQTNLDDIREKYCTYQIVSNELLSKDYFIEKGLEIKEYKNIGNIYWISIKKDEEIDSKLNFSDYSDIREIQSSIEEVVRYEFIS